MSMSPEIPTFHLNLSEDLPPQGDLTTSPGYTILLWAMQHSFNGKLVFEREQRKKILYVEAGTVVDSKSNLVPEGIDSFFSRGFLSTSEVTDLQAEIASASAVDIDKAHLEWIVSHGLLPAEEVDRALQLLLWERCLNLFGWFQGRYSVQTKVRSNEPSSIRKHRVSTSLPDLFKQIEDFLGRGKPWLDQRQYVPEFQGDLRSHGTLSLFHALTTKHYSGRLILTRGQRQKTFRWNFGTITSAASSDPGETLGVILERWKYLQGDVVSRLESTARSRNSRLRDVIREENLLTEVQLSGALTTLHTERILESFSWWSGSYQLIPSSGSKEAPTASPRPTAKLPLAAKELEETTEREIDAQPDDAPSSAAPSATSLAASLDPLFGPPPNNSLLLLELPPTGKSLPEIVQSVGSWHSRGIRTIVIQVGGRTSEDANPSTWNEPTIWKKLLVTSGGVDPDLLVLAHEDRSWRSVDGIERFRRFSSEILSTYDRIVWIAPRPKRGSPIFQAAGKTIFMLSRARTSRKSLKKAMDQVSGGHVAGFVFRETAKSPRWSELPLGFIERLSTKVARWRRPT